MSKVMTGPLCFRVDYSSIFLQQSTEGLKAAADGWVLKLRGGAERSRVSSALTGLNTQKGSELKLSWHTKASPRIKVLPLTHAGVCSRNAALLPLSTSSSDPSCIMVPVLVLSYLDFSCDAEWDVPRCLSVLPLLLMSLCSHQAVEVGG